MRTSPAFLFHAVGAGLTVVLAAALVPSFLLPSRDLLVSGLAGRLFGQFVVTAVVFYGFSLVLLRAFALPTLWGFFYALGSWSLFVRGFVPESGLGVMRRVTEAEYAAEQLEHVVSLIALPGFLLIQASFMVYVLGRMRPPKLPPAPGPGTA